MDLSMTETVVANSEGDAVPPAKPARLMSLDAVRGFDMFWIVGADELVQGLRKASDNSVLQGLAHQLEHVGWVGFHFEDLIFPLFVFIVGVSLVFSLSRTIEQEGKAVAAGRIIRRAALLYLLGIFYYGGFSTPFQGIRLLGVLQRIALCYLFAGLTFCFFGAAWPGGSLLRTARRLLGAHDVRAGPGNRRRTLRTGAKPCELGR